MSETQAEGRTRRDGCDCPPAWLPDDGVGSRVLRCHHDASGALTAILYRTYDIRHLYSLEHAPFPQGKIGNGIVYTNLEEATNAFYDAIGGDYYTP